VYQLLYMTCADRAEAERLAEALLEAKLIACANILPGIHSLFHWNGQVSKSEEVLLLAKSEQALFKAIETKITSLHSYDCPCILAFDIADGHQPFLDWISTQTLANKRSH